MASSCTRLGIAVAINGFAFAFLAAALLGDGGDVRAALSRAYLALMMIAPMAICVLLVLPPLHRNVALKGAVFVGLAALLAAGLDVAGDSGTVLQAGQTLPLPGQLARH